MKRLNSILLWIPLFLFIITCNDDGSLESTYLAPCHPEKETIKTVKNKPGIVSNYHFPRDTVWVIRSTPGENEVFYDSQDVGVVCNFPDSLKIHGLNVTFSGDLKIYDGELKPLFPGDTLYHLLITNIAHRVDVRIP